MSVLGLLPVAISGVVLLSCAAKDARRGAPSAAQAHQAAVAACRAADHERLWDLSSDRLRRSLELRAADKRAFSAEGLRLLYGYRGEPAGFDGKAYLKGVIQSQAAENPCLEAGRWQTTGESTRKRHRVFHVERPDRWRLELWYIEKSGRFLLDVIGDPVPPRG
jgi:hypothetical protein